MPKLNAGKQEVTFEDSNVTNRQALRQIKKDEQRLTYHDERYKINS